ncbi:ATP-binding protein [Starkeya koreensis]|uniref:histidine kinase n=1 Tax=Ancylobacter koreensis TaxID=266121 RepID=A0ABT0DL22_9HYPH|nr:ATP-binding protein [Ancylobacter koreensis]MCK0207981.1 ATP-binding protein [Ancylobacter koreensis]
MTARATRPLGRIVALRVMLFALLAMLGQLIAVLVEYGSDPDYLAQLVLESETNVLAGGLSLANGRLTYQLPPELAARYATPGTGYMARVRTAGGAVLFGQCDEACARQFLPLEVDPPSFWLRILSPGYPLAFAGGRAVERGERLVFFEIVITRDSQHAVWTVLGHEVLDHMLWPMSLTLVFVLGATLFSIRAALRPVAAAAQAAERLDSLSPDARLEEAGMPREIAQLAGAVNRSYARTRELMNAQKLFTSAIAHEIRTPLAVIRLELERIEHPAARRTIAEIDELTHFVEQLIALARLEAVDRSGFARLSLNELGREIVAAMAPFVYAQGASIAFEGSGDPVVAGNAALLRDAVRNLIENAVRHGGPGVAIVVETQTAPGAGAALGVRDDGIGFDPTHSPDAPGHYKRAGGLGIGLEIVRRIAALHGASFEIARAVPRGTQARLVFTGTVVRAPVTPAR